MKLLLLKQNAGFRKFIVWFIISVYIVGVTIVAEYIARRYYGTLCPESGRVAVSIMAGDSGSRQFGYIRSHPYMLYVNQPGWERFGTIQFNSMGYRGEEISLEPDPGVIRILAIGGSTTVGYPHVEKPDQAWPARLESILEKETKTKIEVINAGLASGTSAELLAHYMFRNRYLKPDIVVIHTGGNDSGALMFKDYNPEYTHYVEGWTANPLSLRFGERVLLKSSIIKVFYSWWLKDASIQNILGKRLWFDLFTSEEALSNVNKNEPIGFHRNLNLLVRNIRQDGSIPVLFPFIYAPKSVFERNDINNFLEAHYDVSVIGIRKNIEVMREMAVDNHIPIIEGAKEVIPVDCFLDHCHLNAQGEFIKARHVADYLISIIHKLLQEDMNRSTESF